MNLSTCVRRAWLTLGTSSIELEGNGYGVTELDLGAPVVREVTNDIPDGDGTDDRTAYLGGRVVSISISALVGAGAQIDAVASAFGPYLSPAVRPTLHYILDRPGAAERTLVVRGSAYSWPIRGASLREISLQFLAADPYPRDPIERSSTAWSGSSGAGGRTYPLVFNRVYPGTGGLPAPGSISSPGDVGVQPKLRIFGPITQHSGLALVTFTRNSDGAVQAISLLPGTRIDAGTFLSISSKDHTATLNDDPTRPMLSAIDWTRTTWPLLSPEPDTWQMTLAGDNASYQTQVVATWHDRYLS